MTEDARPASAPALDVSIVLVSYNTREMTLACLGSVERETPRLQYELIVVDNASLDGSADAIAREFPHVKLVRSPANLGFAGGVNLGAQEARGEYLLLLNPDTVVLDRAIERLVAFARSQPRAGIAGGRTLFADHSLNVGCCFRRPTAFGLLCRALGLSTAFPRSPLFNTEAYGGWDRGETREVDVVQGSFFLLPAALWRELGGFASEFFMYGEETDLCLRAKSRGHPVHFYPGASIIHHGGGSEPVRADKQIRLLSAKRLLVQRHFHPAAVPLGLALLRLGPALRALAVRLAEAVGSDPGAARAWREVWRRRAEWDTDAPTWALRTPRPVAPETQS